MILWTGESEYCRCGHHISDHESVGIRWHTEGTNDMGVSPNPTKGAYGKCDKCKQCMEFVPVRFAHQED
jgi:hypothetical protein